MPKCARFRVSHFQTATMSVCLRHRWKDEWILPPSPSPPLPTLRLLSWLRFYSAGCRFNNRWRRIKIGWHWIHFGAVLMTHLHLLTSSPVHAADRTHCAGGWLTSGSMWQADHPPLNSDADVIPSTAVTSVFRTSHPPLSLSLSLFIGRMPSIIYCHYQPQSPGVNTRSQFALCSEDKHAITRLYS